MMVEAEKTLNVQFKRCRMRVMKQMAAIYTDVGKSDKSLNVRSYAQIFGAVGVARVDIREQALNLSSSCVRTKVFGHANGVCPI